MDRDGGDSAGREVDNRQLAGERRVEGVSDDLDLISTLMKLLGHESMVTSQRYVTAAGTQTRAAVGAHQQQSAN
jgi:hypothetical protein